MGVGNIPPVENLFHEDIGKFYAYEFSALLLKFCSLTSKIYIIALAVLRSCRMICFERKHISGSSQDYFVKYFS